MLYIQSEWVHLKKMNSIAFTSSGCVSDRHFTKGSPHFKHHTKQQHIPRYVIIVFYVKDEH